MADQLFNLPGTRTPVSEFDGIRDYTRRGKVSELTAALELMKRGHDIAMPLVDDNGIDLVVNCRLGVQVKSASRPMKAGIGTYNFCRNNSRFHADVYMLHASDIDVWWIIPTAVLQREGIREESRSLAVSTTPVAHLSRRCAALSQFRDAWHIFDRPRDWIEL